jgi:hypothetical protein
VPAFAEFAALVRADAKPLRGALRAALLGRFERAAPVETEDAPFPFLKLMERIVVVDVPHLYEVDALNERTSLCEDLNSFVPMAPVDERLAGNERVRIICETLETVDLPPYRAWARLMADGGALIGGGGVAAVDLRRVEGAVLEIPLPIEAEEGNDDEDTVVEAGGEEEDWGMGLAIIGPEPFLPSMEMVNLTGVEYFEHILSAESGEA